VSDATASRGPQFLAHRGYQVRYPENTRESLAAAVDTGAVYIEFDVQLSRDGVPVVLHDPTLLRTADIDRRVFDLSARELADVEVNERSRLGDAFTDVLLPSLEDVARQLVAWPNVTAFVELKPQSMTRFGSSAMVDAVLHALRDVLDRCVLISFVHDVVRETRERASVPVGWVLSEWNPGVLATAEAMPPEFLFFNEKLLPPVGPVWPGPWTWVCYDIVDYSRALALHERGIDVISTFDIARMLAAHQVSLNS